MAGYPVINPAGADILNVDGTTTHYNQGETVPLSKLISRRYSWLVERGYLSEDFAEVFDTSTVNGDLTVTGGLFTEYIAFNTSSPYHTVLPGELSWNNDEGTLDLGLQGGNVTLSLGQEEVVRIKNNTGSPLTDGQIVYVTGSIGSGSNYRITVALAQANAEATSSKTFGVVTETIANGSEGFVCTFGLVRNINTASFNEGDSLYLSPTTAGQLTNVKPSAPNHMVFIGWVIRKNSTEGTVFVHPQNGYELDELHDVGITSKADNDILSYDSTLGYWKNQNLATAVNEVGSSINSLSNYLPLTGGTLTGDLTVSKATAAIRSFASSGNARVFIDTDSNAASKGLVFRKGTSIRWGLYSSNEQETGSDAGSNFHIYRANDAGSETLNLQILRSTGKWTFLQVGATAGLELGANGPRVMSGTGSPETVVSAPVGSIWVRSDGGAGTSFYVKESGTGNTGWVPTVTPVGAYLPLTGGTLTGNLSITKADPRLVLTSTGFSEPFIQLTGNSGQRKVLAFQTGAIDRFRVGVTGTAEDGSTSVGSDFVITRKVDGGAETDALTINRASGLATLTGDLTISKSSSANLILTTSSGYSVLDMRSPAGQPASIDIRSGTAYRWSIGKNAAAESGSDAGSNFVIYGYKDDASYITPLTITRSTGAVTLTGNLTINKASPFISVTSTSGNFTFLASTVSGSPSEFVLRTSGVNRWIFGTNGAVETGINNAGTNFTILAYNDAGSLLSTPLTIARSTGNITLTGILTNSNTTDSTSYNDGAVVLSGGMGISKNLNVGWNINGYSSIANQRAGQPYITGLTYCPGLSSQTGAQVIQTTLPRTMSGMQIIRVHGWAYAGARIDFTIRWYQYQGANDPNGNPGQIWTPQLIDLGTDTFTKRIGMKGDNVIIAIGDTNSNTSYVKFTVDCHFVNTNPTEAQIDGWSVATNTTTSPYTFGADYEPITLTNQASLMIQGASQTFSGIKTFSDTTDSSSTTTGAVIVSGGVGIAKQLYVGSSITQTSGSIVSTNNPAAKIRLGRTNGANAPTTISAANYYLELGSGEWNTNSYRLIGFGYRTNHMPAYIGFQEKDINANTKGDLIFGTRDVTTDTEPTERLRIAANGVSTFTSKVVSTALDITTGDTNGNLLKIFGEGATNGMAITTNWNTGNAYLDFRLGGTTTTYNTLRLNNGGIVQMPGTTDSTSSTTGTLQVSGGVGIAKNLYVGGKLTLRNSAGTENMFMHQGYAVLGLVTIGRSGSGYGTVGDGYRTSASSSTYLYDRADYATMLDFTNGGFTFRTSAVGVAGDTVSFSTRLTISNSGAITTSSTFAQSNTTDSSSSITGALTTAGGVGVAKNLYVGTGITTSGNASNWALVLNNEASDGSTNIWRISPTGSAWAAGDNRLVVHPSGSSADSVFTVMSSNYYTGIGRGNYTPGATLDVRAYAAAEKGLIVKGATAQSANLQEWQNSAATVVASVSPSGAFTAVTKSFDIEHPTQENMRLRYGSLEGPENGVYIRGKSSSRIVPLPDYWTELINEDTITVQLTSKGKYQNLYVEDIVDNCVYVGGIDGEYFYFIQAERKDVDKLVVEYGS